MSRGLSNKQVLVDPTKLQCNSRKFGRVFCERLVCFLGDAEGHSGIVLDLSAGGARLAFRSKPMYKAGDRGTVIVESPTCHPLSISMRVAWYKKRGFRRHELGISFGEPSAVTRAALAQLVRTASATNTVYRGDLE